MPSGDLPWQFPLTAQPRLLHVTTSLLVVVVNVTVNVVVVKLPPVSLLTCFGLLHLVLMWLGHDYHVNLDGYLDSVHMLTLPQSMNWQLTQKQSTHTSDGL